MTCSGDNMMLNSVASRLKQRLLGNKEVKNAGWLIAGKVIQMVLSFFISILTARYLGPSNYGIINYSGAYVTFFSSICTLGINFVIVKDFFDDPDNHGEIIGTTLILRILASFFSSLTIIGIVAIVDKGEPVTLLVTALSSVQLIFHVCDTFSFWFQSRYESKVTAIATLIAYVITSAYKIVLLIQQKDVAWFALATSVDYFCLGVFLYLSYKRADGPGLSFSWAKGKSLLSRSYHYILSGMMVAIYGQTDKLMLKQMLDEASVGYYSLAASINVMWVFVLQAIIDSIHPTIMQYYNSGDVKAFERKNRQLYTIVFYVSVSVAVLFVLFGKIAVRILYGVEYLPAAEPLKIIAWYTGFSYLGVARNAWVICNNKQKYLKYMFVTAAIFNVILNYFLIPTWGANGAAVASLITQILTSLIIPAFIPDMRENVKLMIQALLLKDFLSGRKETN